jgi:hypothetical protein
MGRIDVRQKVAGRDARHKGRSAPADYNRCMTGFVES